MNERMRISWRLAGSTLRLLRDNTDLLIFPIIGVLAYSLLLALLAAVALWWVEFRLDLLWNAPLWIKLPALYFIYILGYMTVFSANTAMVGMTMLAFEGQHPTFVDGWRIAFMNRKNLLIYAFFAATAGMALNIVSRWTGRVGKYGITILQRVVIFSVFSLAWQLVPLLIIPVLVNEQIGPLEAIQHCSRLVTNVWGEGVIRYANLWSVFWVPLTGAIVAGVASVIWASYSAQELLVTTSAYCFVMAVAILFIAASALSGIYSAIVYRYACALPIPAPFEKEMVSKAFIARPSRTLHRLSKWWKRQGNSRQNQDTDER